MLNKILLSALLALLCLNSVALILETKPFVEASGITHPSPYYKVEPKNVTMGPWYAIDQTFTVAVKLYNVTVENSPYGVLGVEIHLHWNKTLIQPISYVSKIGMSGGVLNQYHVALWNGFCDQPPPGQSMPPDQANYYIVVAASLGSPWWGDGTVVEITFKVVHQPHDPEPSTGCPLELTFTDLVGFWDSCGRQIPHEKESGYYQIIQEGFQEVRHSVVVGETSYLIATSSNSTISTGDEFVFDNATQIVDFNASAPSGTTGFCNTTIPKEIMNPENVMNGTFAILVNDTAIPYDIIENGTHHTLQFSYSHSLEQIRIELTILADINGDRKVSLIDLTYLAKAYGSEPGDPNWKAVADIRKDNKVNLQDLVILADQYGKEYH
jgi:hypothetical protein